MSYLKIITYTLFLFSLLSCGGAAEQEAHEETKAPAEQGLVYSDSIRQGLQNILQSYYQLKDALVSADSVKAGLHALSLSGNLEAIDLSSIQQKDSLLYASIVSLPATISKASAALNKSATLESQREIFETISDNLFELIYTLKPSGIETYQQYCPMAFNDKGASWLSDTAHIQNPYFGKKMLTCGEVKQALRYK